MKGLEPSLLEKLFDDNPRSAGAGSMFKSISLEQYKESIARDLEGLLNSRAAFQESDMAEFPNCRQSLLTYGLADFSAIPGVPSQVTLRQLIKDNPDFPAKPGTNGVAYEIDVAAAIAWLKARDERRIAAERTHADKVRQLGLELLGEDAAANVDQAGLGPSERKALLEEEFFAIKVAEKRGELIRKADIEAAISDVLVRDAQRRATFMARLAKRVDLEREAIAAGEVLMDADRRAFASALERLTETTDADAATGPDPAV